MNYDDVRERLAVLRDNKLTPERERHIRALLQTEFERYRAGELSGRRSRRPTWPRNVTIFGVAAAAIVIVAGIGGGQFGPLFGHEENRFDVQGARAKSGNLPSPANPTFGTTSINGSTLSNATVVNQSASGANSALQNVSLASVTYSANLRAQLAASTQTTGVVPYVPTMSVPEEQLIIVKPTPCSLILDYRQLWIVEDNGPFTPVRNPEQVSSVKGMCTRAHH